MRTGALLLLQLMTISLFGQGTIGSWEDHLPYHSLKTIVAGENNIYSASEYSIAVYNKAYQEIHKLSTVHGLSECGISALAYSDNNNTLIIAYHSTNIDLYSNNVITNIPDISNKYIAGRKSINSISTVGRFAYLSTSFGLVVLDIEDLEINDTWNPSLTSSPTEVFDIAILGSTIYATTSDGVLSADLNNPGLAYFGNWQAVSGLEDGSYNSIAATEDKLFISKKALGTEGDSLLILSQGEISAISTGSGQSIHSLRYSNNSVIVAKYSEIELYNTDGILIREISDYGWGATECMDAIFDNNKLFIADYSKGLVIEHSSNSFESVIIPGPWSISSAHINSSDGNVYIAAGELTNSWDNTWKPFETSVSLDRIWSSFTDISSSDAISIIPIPGDPSKTYVATWGTGLFKLDESGIVEHFDDSNSPLESMIPGSDYVRIGGMTFDENNYLWLTQSGVQNSIKILKPDNSWIVLPYNINSPLVGEIIISRSGKKWIILPNGNGLFVLDDNRSPDNFGDDQWIKLNVQDQFGKSLNNIYSLAEDLDGNIWIGTDQGPAIYYNPNRVFSEDIFCYRIKVSRNDGSGLADYLLGTEKIKNISIDGGNRKWLGTNNSGVFLIGEEGNKLVKSYSEDNSPLLSDTITSLAINEITGEVWIGSSKGVISVREEATEGDVDFKKVYAFPNPVHPDFNGPVTITGLARNTKVKISDVSGNLVYETTSTGGQATWDLNNYKKQRVATGVYLAFCSTEDGSTSDVVKILIIR